MPQKQYRTDFSVQPDAKVACWCGEKEGHMKKAIQRLRTTGWLNSNGAVKHTAACEKSYISGVIRKSTEKPYFQKALLGAVLA